MESKLKQYLRTVEARTYETLDRAITEAIDLVVVLLFQPPYCPELNPIEKDCGAK